MNKSTAQDLFKRHHLSLFRYLRRMTENSDQAEELTQEVFLRVLRGLSNYREEGREEAWLFQIARNLVLNKLRDRNRQPKLEMLNDMRNPSYPARQLEKLGLEQALSRLNDADREIFLLREIAGLGYEEISRVCDLSVDAVKSRIYRARINLRAFMSMKSEP
ncbi:MAG: RNA polymerase sigma factor [Acidobacteriota bacterium]